MNLTRVFKGAVAGVAAVCLVAVVAIKEPKFPALSPAAAPVELVTAEAAPFVYKGQLLTLACVRPVAMTLDGARLSYLSIRDGESGSELSRFGQGYGLASIIVKNDVAYVAASRFERGNWNDVTIFSSTDLSTWDSRIAIQQTRSERLFNSSMCETEPGQYLMAYETNDRRYVGFSVKFARSSDLINWKPISGLVFGKDRYTACPMIRHYSGWTYLLVLEHPDARYITKIYRSRDLINWHPGNRHFLAPVAPHTNASDVDMIDHNGRTEVTYIQGNQVDHVPASSRWYTGSQRELLESFFLTKG